MKKTFFFTMMALAVIAGLAAQNLPRLAVAAFTTNVDTNKSRADSITVRDIVESEMTMTGKYRMVARNEIDELLANQRIQMSEISSMENIKKLEIANINYIVTGSVNVMDDDYQIIVRVLDVSSGIFSYMERGLMGSSSRELDAGLTDLMKKFIAGMATDESGAIVQASELRAQQASGIAIEVKTDKGGDLYFQGNKVATLWDNDTHTITIENPGTYSLRLVLLNKNEKISSVSITSRGITKLDFSTVDATVFKVGNPGPADGIIFYDKGNNSGGWRYLEAAPVSTEFSDDLDRAIQKCKSMNYGGFTNWRLPSKGELDLMYKNLKQKGLGGFKDSWYRSSSQYDNEYVWGQDFSDGKEVYLRKAFADTVRAVRAF